jgi:hypothetical protein
MFGKDKGNSTCPLPKDESSLLLVGEPIVGSLTFQHLILIISIACAGATAVLTLWLILKHLHRYTRPNEQRQIIRIIFTPVVFAALSVLAILNYNAANYLTPLQDLYEGFALASLFLLFTQFVAPDEDTREAYFFNLENRKKRGSKFSRSKEYDVVPGGSLMWFKVCNDLPPFTPNTDVAQEQMGRHLRILHCHGHHNRRGGDNSGCRRLL